MKTLKSTDLLGHKTQEQIIQELTEENKNLKTKIEEQQKISSSINTALQEFMNFYFNQSS